MSVNAPPLLCENAGGDEQFTEGEIYKSFFHDGGLWLCFGEKRDPDSQWFKLKPAGDGAYTLEGYVSGIRFRVASDTEIDLSNVVAFPARESDPMDLVGLLHVDSQICAHSQIYVSEKERQCRCKKCGSVIDPFDYLLSVATKETRFASNLDAIMKQESAVRQNVERLIKIERNAKARARRAEPGLSILESVLGYCETAVRMREDLAPFAAHIIKMIERGK